MVELLAWQWEILYVFVAWRVVFYAVGYLSGPLAQEHGMDRKKTALWRNTFVSFLHATAVCLLTFVGFVGDAKSWQDLIEYENPWLRMTMVVSTAYFVHDFCDMYLSGIHPILDGIFLHHLVVITAFLTALSSHANSGYVAACLLVEFHGMWLHARQLVRLLGLQRTHPLSTAVRTLNSLTIVPFRLYLHLHLPVRVYLERHRFPSMMHVAVAAGGMLAVSVMNFVLAYRFFRSEYFKVRENGEKCKTT